MNTVGLTSNALHVLAPAIYNKVPLRGLSVNYEFVDTEQILLRMLKEGFVPVRVAQNSGRDTEHMLTTRHMIRFRKAQVELIEDEVYPEVIIENAHNGDVPLAVYGGLYRPLCANGLVVTSQNKARHYGTGVHEIIEKGFALEKEMSLIGTRLEALKHIDIQNTAQCSFATRASLIAYGAEHPLTLESASLLHTRHGDKQNNVWNVFNNIQENIMRGGLSYNTAAGRTVTTKGITRVKRDIKTNIDLWQLMEQTAGKLSTAYTDLYL